MTKTLLKSRRAFIKMMMAATAFMLWPFSGYPVSGAERAGVLFLLKRESSAFFRNPESARIVGRAYLERFPQEASGRRLCALLRPESEEGLTDMLAMTHREFAAWLNSHIRRDFRNGNTLQLEGWILSRTEARFCALTAL